MKRVRVRALAPWLLAGIVAFPVAVVSHELGHWFPARLLGVQELVLHYGSISDATSEGFWQLVRDGQLDAAAAVHPLWQPPVIALGGLLVTYATALACYWHATRRKPNPFLVALATIAVFRFIGGVPIVFIRLFRPQLPASADETHAALGMVIPEMLLLAAGFGMMWLVWWRLPRQLIRERGRWPYWAMLLGSLIGGVLYIRVLGPRLLP